MEFVPEEVSRDIIYKGRVSTLVVNTKWNSHGKLIPFSGRNGNTSETMKNVDIEVVSIKYQLFDTIFDNTTLYINTEEYGGEVYSISGNNLKLVVTACIGTG